jgi:hypothetical protein
VSWRPGGKSFHVHLSVSEKNVDINPHLYYIIPEQNRKEVKMTQASTLSVRTDKDLRPTKTTLKAVEDIEKGKNIKRFETAEKLFEDLGI